MQRVVFSLKDYSNTLDNSVPAGIASNDDAGFR
jgi:hypothetical protein